MRFITRATILALILAVALGWPASAQIVTPGTPLGVATETSLATYHCSGFVTPAAVPTDIVTLTGSGTKTIHVMKISVTIESTATGIADVAILRRSTADTGGTSTTPTIAKMATANAAATAVCTQYTANPTTGTLVAQIDAAKTSGTQNPMVFIYGQNTQSIILSSTTDILAINGNGDTLLSAEVWAYMVEWTEQ